MKATLWGTRGSVGRAGPETLRYGGDTASIEVRGEDGSWLLLDGGSGLLRVTPRVGADVERIDVLVTHLHMDHIQGLGFFYPLRNPDVETHIWGPISTTLGLADRLGRYLSPPLFPVRLREMKALYLHDVGPGTYRVGSFKVSADLVIHPGPTLGYRIEENGATLAYIPDHEPALGLPVFPGDPRWTSGFDLIQGADCLIHDSQYTDAEYAGRVGWGHSTIHHLLELASQAGARRVVTYHHDPEHSDDMLDVMLQQATNDVKPTCDVLPGKVGTVLEM